MEWERAAKEEVTEDAAAASTEASMAAAPTGEVVLAARKVVAERVAGSAARVGGTEEEWGCVIIEVEGFWVWAMEVAVTEVAPVAEMGAEARAQAKSQP